METEVMTVEQVINITIGNLNSISVPCALIEQIGVPISQAVQNLQQCSRALAENRIEQEKQQEQGEE